MTIAAMFETSSRSSEDLMSRGLHQHSLSLCVLYMLRTLMWMYRTVVALGVGSCLAFVAGYHIGTALRRHTVCVLHYIPGIDLFL